MDSASTIQIRSLANSSWRTHWGSPIVTQWDAIAERKRIQALLGEARKFLQAMK
jgi:hypothetical protein